MFYEKLIIFRDSSVVEQFPPEADQPLAGAVIHFKYMFTVYILKSLKNNKRYVGYTSKDSFQRLAEHNRGCNKWTKHNGPFTIVYTEGYDDKQNAIKREKFLKSGQGRKFLDEKLKK